MSNKITIIDSIPECPLRDLYPGQWFTWGVALGIVLARGSGVTGVTVFSEYNKSVEVKYLPSDTVVRIVHVVKFDFEVKYVR